jgi:lipopolysaccharide/colanic/teichoic acid biosynthesis glycosyltransferase
VLRRTHLDEIPQLLNVLRNEMSIVGPRPERPEFMELLEAEIPYWSRRLLMKPGVTGWAQVHHGYTSDATGTATKLSFDLWYFKYRSMLLDAAILAMTLKVAILGTGAR